MDELIEKIKTAPLALKIGMVLILGTSFSVYSFFTDTPELEQKLVNSQGTRNIALATYTKAKEDTEKLIKLEVTLKTIREQLEKAKKYLPDKIEMDEVLHTAARFCSRYKVSLEEFTPLSEEQSKSEARYGIKPVSVKLKGRFVDITRFFDSVVHLEKIVHLRNVTLTKSQQEEGENSGDIDLFRMTPEQRQRYAERNTKVEATADLLLFKSGV
ncbi:type 4a pilus biogenesis protein PilO [Oligoflexaceae bacterium]|nr:type 4a pilus biogenesis protein PilO [Oligoflexaceae bacterium]